MVSLFGPKRTTDYVTQNLLRRMAAVVAVLVLASPALVRAEQVGLIKIDGAIGPATAIYISRAIDQAAAAH